MRHVGLVGFVLSGLLLAGCSNLNKTQNGALLGAGTGAVAGQLIGGDTKGTLIGAGIGGVTGALAGDYMEKKEVQDRSQGYHQGYNQGYQQGYGSGQQAPMAYGGPQNEPPGDQRW
jgi:hypothetical protein